MNRFRRYEENYLNSTRIVNHTLQRLSLANGVIDDVISITVEIESELSESEGYLRAMDVEHRTVGPQDKRSAQEKVQDYRNEYREMLTKFKTAKHEAELLALRGGGNESRARLLKANARLDSSTATLQNSRQLVSQTEQIGGTILTDMAVQREILLNADEKVEETRGFTSQAKGVLKMMSNRALYHKVCIYAWIVILFIAILCIVYFGFIAPDEKK